MVKRAGERTEELGSSRWARSSLATKLVIVTSVSTVFVMAVIAGIMGWQSLETAKESVHREMGATLEGVDRSMQLAYTTASSRAAELLPALERELGGRPRMDGSADDGGVPLLIVEDTIVNGDVSHLMRMNENTGADPAVIVKAPHGWVRVATLLRDQQGDLQLNSVVEPDDLLARTLDSGEAYGGLVQRNGRWYAMRIEPLKDDSGEVYGGLSVRVDVHDQIAAVLSLVQHTRVAEFGHLGLVQADTGGQPEWIAAAADAREALQGETADAWAVQRSQPTGFAELPGEQGNQLIVWRKIDNWNWTLIGIGDSSEFMAASLRALLIQLALVLGGAALIAMIVGWLTARTLRPVRDIVRSMQSLGRGDLSATVPVAPGNSRNEVHALYEYLRHTQASLQRAIGTVRSSVDEINLGANEIAAGNIDLSSRTEQQAAALQQTAASMEQLAAVVRQNSDNARQANELAVAASSVAEQGGVVVEGVISSMERISTGSSRIGEIVSVIDGIAFQTNILALNAAVEAARAGEQGKGFAVVASEVRSLAQRSAQAAKEIKGLIESSIDEIHAGERQVKAAGTTMQEIVASVSRVTQIMQDIAHASDEQSSGIEQVNTAVTQMDAATQQNAALVQEAASAAESLREQARRLSEAVAVFKLPEHTAREVIDVTERSARAASPALEPAPNTEPQTRLAGAAALQLAAHQG